MAAPRRLGLGVRSVTRAGGDASVSFSLMYRNKTISEQIDSRGHMPAYKRESRCHADQAHMIRGLTTGV